MLYLLGHNTDGNLLGRFRTDGKTDGAELAVDLGLGNPLCPQGAINRVTLATSADHSDDHYEKSVGQIPLEGFDFALDTVG